MSGTDAQGSVPAERSDAVSLTVGERLGPYEIRALAGVGGMGEVYRALDLRLDREVALKLLPPGRASRGDRVARFEREARALAALNHANIATVYGIERDGGHLFFTMELVEGQTLADRILRGPLGVDEALSLFEQLALALEAAHGRGLIHRDLKPSNLMVTPSGTLKVLDFGLVKAWGDGQAGDVDRSSVTLSDDPTLSGGRAGTPAYMSPEQMRGEPASRSTDLWAFGCCLYEALTGVRPFTGGTRVEVEAAILTQSPDFRLLPAGTPPSILVLLRRCLQKDPRRRLRDAGDARLEIEDARTAPSTRSRGAFEITGKVALAVAGVIALLAMAKVWPSSPPRETPPRPETRFNLQLPPGYHLHCGPPTLSPDGRRLALTVVDDRERTAVWLRTLDEVEARPVPGTEGATTPPFWDPTGQFLGFATEVRVRAIALSGGEVRTLAEVPDVMAGSWGRDEVLLVRKDAPLHRVAVRGSGSSSPATAVGGGHGETHLWPHFLPDGRRFLYVAMAKGSPTVLYAGDLDSNLKRRILEDVSQAHYVEPGLLFFARRTGLLAQRFDIQRLELVGEPFRMADPIVHLYEWAFAPFSVSANRVLLYASPQQVLQSRLVWRDRAGRRLGTVGEDAIQAGPALSPDGRRLAIERRDADMNGNLWMYDLERGTEVRLTSAPERESDPVWSPDGETITFARTQGGVPSLFRMPIGGGPPEMLSSGTIAYPTDWTPDGRTLVYAALRGSARADIEWISAGGAPQVYLRTSAQEHQARLSPDGRWIAYASTESGRAEVYVDRFPGRGRRQVVSSAGGAQPMWRRDGAELFYVSSDGKMMAVPIAAGSTVDAGRPQELFQTELRGPDLRDTRNGYAVSADGRRFIMLAPTSQPAVGYTVVVGWTTPAS